MFIVALFTIAKTLNQPKCSSVIDWTRKMWHIYTMEYYAAIKMVSYCPLKGHGWIMKPSFSANWHKSRKSNTTWSHSQTGVEQWEYMDTRRGASHTGVCLGGMGRNSGEWGGWGGITWGEMPDISNAGWRQQTTLPCVYLCYNPAWSAHESQNLKYNKKKRKESLDPNWSLSHITSVSRHWPSWRNKNYW